jgi:2-polyprenyl-6-methoxyphenol hydroxylase-like FAD-dependent oxidoreductase
MVEDDSTHHRSSQPSAGATPAPLHVLIVGGGVGGLCLAQGLKKSGISVAVHERDESTQLRSQGYRIGLKEAGAQALRDCLPENLFNLCMATSIKQATRMVFLDHQLNQKFSKPIPQIEPGVSGFGVNRLTLREILLADLDDMVHFGKTFERFAQGEDGQVRAYFADGTAATGDLLVGADGTDSAVRDLLVPDAVIDELHYAIYGKTPITADTLAWVPDVLIDSFNRVIGPEGAAMAVATCRTREPVADATAKFAPRLHLTDMPGYLSWTMTLADEQFRSADGPTLHRVASDTVKQWHPSVRRIIDEADIPATFAITITSARLVKQWRATNVTLLGDAIHTMSPGRGEGANVALRDAQQLRHALVDVAAKRVPFVQAKAQYEAEMLRYGFEAVADSLNKPFAPWRPGQGQASTSHTDQG